MKAIAISEACELEQSKLFGEAYLPEEWLENDIFSIYEFFLGQINLSEFSCEFLPKSGYLYFFIEASSLKSSKMKAVVRYYQGEPSACTDFNDGLFDEEEEFALAEGGFGNIQLFEQNDDNITLISIPTELLPFECDYSRLRIDVDKAGLLKQDFSSCKLIFE